MDKLPALVMVTTSFPIASDGSEAAGSFVSDLAEALSQHVKVRVVAPGPEQAHEILPGGIEVFRFPSPAKPLSTLSPARPSDLLALARVMKEGQAAVDRAVRAGSTAHILALWALPSGHWARRCARREGLGYSVWTLGSDIWSLGKVPLLRQYLRRVLRDAKHCCSDGLQLAEDTQRIARRPVEFLPSTRRIGLDAHSSPRKEPPYRLLFIGRWHPNKGIDLLLEALALLQPRDWSLIEQVEIYGGGPLHEVVHQRARALADAGHPVHVGGYLAKREAESAIANADRLLIPSRIESIPVVFSDAMKLGRPVVAMPVGDLPTLVEQHGVGVCSGQVSALAFAEAIRTSLASGTPDEQLHGIDKVAALFSLEDAIVPRILSMAGYVVVAGKK